MMYTEQYEDTAVLELEQLELDFFEKKTEPGIREIIDELRKEIGYNWVSYFKKDPVSGVLQEVELDERGFNLIETVTFKNGSGLSAWVAEHQRSVVLGSVHKSQRFESNPIKSFMCCPVIRDGITVGVVNLGHTKTNEYNKETLKKLNHILNVQNIEALCQNEYS